MVNSIVVLGGGNAGFMSALYLNASLQGTNIKVIKSSKIGTIGVGEGSTEHWRRFADAVGIELKDLINECGATIKIGIKFNDKNWILAEYNTKSTIDKLELFSIQKIELKGKKEAPF